MIYIYIYIIHSLVEQSHYNSADIFVIQSTDFLSGTSVPRFLLRIFNDLKFEAYHCGVRCTIRTLSVNRICVLIDGHIYKRVVDF